MHACELDWPLLALTIITHESSLIAIERRLNYRLSIACHDTIMNKCADACTSTSIDQPCGGTVLRCLTEKLDEITDAECKKEVFYFIKMEVWRLPPGRACYFCTDVLHPCSLSTCAASGGALLLADSA